MKKHFQSLALCGLLAVHTSCSTHFTGEDFDDPKLEREWASEAAYISESGYSYWDDKVNGPLRVEIDLSDQTAYFFRAGTPAGKSRVATGRTGHDTPTGSFSIMAKESDKRSNLYGRIIDASGKVLVADADTRRDSVPAGARYVGASMPYWMRLTSSGIGMHAGPIPNPGQPASHGCIRMPREMARLLFINAPVGTPVTIVP